MARTPAPVTRDAENPQWTKADFAKAKPAKDVLPPQIYEAAKRYRGQRGPQKAPVKQSVTLRLDPEIIAHYKAGGPGWQVRLNEDLRQTVSRRSKRVRSAQ